MHQLGSQSVSLPVSLTSAVSERSRRLFPSFCNCVSCYHLLIKHTILRLGSNFSCPYDICAAQFAFSLVSPPRWLTLTVDIRSYVLVLPKGDALVQRTGFDLTI